MDFPEMQENRYKLLLTYSKRTTNFFVVIAIFFAIIILSARLLPEDIGSFFLGAPIITLLLAGIFSVVFAIIGVYSLVMLYTAISIRIKYFKKSDVTEGESVVQTFPTKRYNWIIIGNGLIVLLFLLQFGPRFIGNLAGRNARLTENNTRAIEELQNEPNKIKDTLSRFKDDIVNLQTSYFTGYGQISNNGDCSHPAVGSLFNPGTSFTPSTIISQNEYKQKIEMYSTWIKSYVIDSEVINNFSDARCYSTVNHFAYQIPSYYERVYPQFYCVDDMHAEVQVSNKKINGPNCESFDPNYVPPNPKPTPDTAYYKYNLKQ